MFFYHLASCPVRRLNVSRPACVPSSKTVLAESRYVKVEGMASQANRRLRAGTAAA